MRFSLAITALCTHGLLFFACNASSNDAKVDERSAPEVEHPSEPSGEKNSKEEGCIYSQEHAEEDAACPHGSAAPADSQRESGHFGAAFALQDPQPLTQAITQFDQEQTKVPIQVRGQIDTVCQKKGCWFVVKDGDSKARVLMQDHAFTVPMTSKGKATIIEGTLSAQTFTEAQVKHLEKDAGRNPDAVQGTRTEYVITATGIEII